MIVVIGHPLAAVGASGDRRPAGPAATAALEAVRAGAEVQLVGKIGDDDTGDAVLLALGAAGVGHVALLRDPARPTPVLREERSNDLDQGGNDPDSPWEPPAIEPSDPDRRPTVEAADVELALRYLTDFRVVLTAEPLPESVLRIVAEAAGYSGAALIVVALDPAATGAAVPGAALVLEPPGGDLDGAFAVLLGQVAAAVDGGASAPEAFARVAGRLGATRPD